MAFTASGGGHFYFVGDAVGVWPACLQAENVFVRLGF